MCLCVCVCACVFYLCVFLQFYDLSFQAYGKVLRLDRSVVHKSRRIEDRDLDSRRRFLIYLFFVLFFF